MPAVLDAREGLRHQDRHVAAAADDPAGDERPEISMAEHMLEDLKAKKEEL